METTAGSRSEVTAAPARLTLDDQGSCAGAPWEAASPEGARGIGADEPQGGTCPRLRREGCGWSRISGKQQECGLRQIWWPSGTQVELLLGG